VGAIFSLEQLTVLLASLQAERQDDYDDKTHRLLTSNFYPSMRSPKTGTQLIVFRAFSGVAGAFCLSSAVSLINNAFPPGRSRNMAFAFMGDGQPLGFGIGLVLGGVFTGPIGWKWGFHVVAIVNLVTFGLPVFYFPRPEMVGVFS
jgi:MFS family permease